MRIGASLKAIQGIPSNPEDLLVPGVLADLQTSLTLNVMLDLMQVCICSRYGVGDLGIQNRVCGKLMLNSAFTLNVETISFSERVGKDVIPKL